MSTDQNAEVELESLSNRINSLTGNQPAQQQVPLPPQPIEQTELPRTQESAPEAGPAGGISGVVYHT